MFNDDNDAPGRYCHAECTWGTNHRGVGSGTGHDSGTQIDIIVVDTAFEDPPDWREQDSSVWKEHLQRDEHHEIDYDFHSCGGSSTWSHSIRENHDSGGLPLDLRGQINSLEDVTMSWSGTAPQPSRSRHSPSTFSSSNQTLDHNFLSPYPGVSGHRRSPSDTSSGTFMRSGRSLSSAEPAPPINGYPQYEESAYNDRNGSGSPSWSSVSSEGASADRSPNLSPQSNSSYLPYVDGSTEKSNRYLQAGRHK
ncbi:hypothetical protein MVEN_01869100 [Mycena venus]|uniref:Uncharacterized protein n=1 Tax=Mycena venus TaxID=2733690 RepID=A0A8H6XHT7_9AGAR|nr:hypothetical protein MVEN_01869100 [Mycena venus]